jgi:rhodanese-related sulfurtransferase
MKPHRRHAPWILALILTLVGSAATASTTKTATKAKPPTSPANVFRATLGETGVPAPEISTEDLKRVLASGEGTVFDARPYAEFAMGHIPGARNVAAKPGIPMSDYVSDVAEIGRVLQENKAAAIVVYCNGPFCGKSKRLAGELASAGYQHVKRYQLGIPVWRALGEATQIEAEGLRRVLAEDHTAFVIDTREPAAFQVGSLPGARNIPRSLVLPGKDVGVVKEAKNDGRLPMEDHNTRVIVVGATGGDARYVADALTHEAFHNVAFFDGAYDAALAAVK